MTTIQKGFGLRVSAIRIASQLGKEAFAREVLSPRASAKNIGRIESEEVLPRNDTLQKICDFGNVDMSWVATGKCVLKPSDIVATIGVGDRIKATRKAANLSCRKLAKVSKLGDSSKNVQRYEIGETSPTFGSLQKLAAALNVSATYLAYGV